MDLPLQMVSRGVLRVAGRNATSNDSAGVVKAVLGKLMVLLCTLLLLPPLTLLLVDWDISNEISSANTKPARQETTCLPGLVNRGFDNVMAGYAK